MLGRTGVRVSELCLGAMMFGSLGNRDRRDCVRMIQRALDGGINMIDTADIYSGGESEEIVGEALRGRRDEVVLATKLNRRMGPGLNDGGNSRLWIMRAVEASLRRLGTDHIDLYQLHRPDPRTDLEESLEALSDLVHQGKVRYVGTSAFPAFELVEAQWIAERRGLSRPACEQVSYSMMVRHAERETFPVAQRYRLGAIVYSPLAGGWLTGRYRRGEPPPEGTRMDRAVKEGLFGRWFSPERPETERRFDVVERLSLVAQKAGASLTEMAIAFTLAHPAVSASIIGPRTMEQLEGALEAVEVRLDDDTLDAIDDAVAPGTLVDDADRGWNPPWMAPEARRRRD